MKKKKKKGWEEDWESGSCTRLAQGEEKEMPTIDDDHEQRGEEREGSGSSQYVLVAVGLG